MDAHQSIDPVMAASVPFISQGVVHGHGAKKRMIGIGYFLYSSYDPLILALFVDLFLRWR